MEKFANFDLEMILKHALTTAVIVVVALFIWIILARSMKALEARSRVSKTVLLPIRLVTRYGIVLLTLLLVLSSYGIPIGNFWTFVSTLLGLVAIGFVAVWSVLSNVSSTFLLLVVQPFRVGDYVKLVGDDVRGVVVDINFMFTTLRSHNGDIFKVPNNQFFQKTTLRPVDTSEDDGDEKEKAEVPDHSQANLEGIQLPGPKGAR